MSNVPVALGPLGRLARITCWAAGAYWLLYALVAPVMTIVRCCIRRNYRDRALPPPSTSSGDTGVRKRDTIRT